MEQKTYMRSIRSSGVWNGLLSACPGVGNLRPLQISAGVPGGGGGMATSQIEPCKFSSFYLPEKLKGLINSRSRVLVFFKSL